MARQEYNGQYYYEQGNKYFYGKGVAVNYDEAAKNYRYGAVKGHAAAQACLGYCYESESGGARICLCTV